MILGYFNVLAEEVSHVLLQYSLISLVYLNYFHRDKKYTGYHLNHLNADDINEVSGVSGSCMVIRNNVIDDIGYFDEQYFAYQEDSDYCLTAKNNGWKIYYYPESIVKHIGGQGGSHSVRSRAIFEWHRSYVRYFYKHFANDYPNIFNIFYLIIMIASSYLLKSHM